MQAGTRENLKMIAAQRDALEAARKSREDALKATKVRMLSYGYTQDSSMNLSRLKVIS